MLGWFRLTATFASSSNIWRNCGVSASDGWICLMTRIFERPPTIGSRARNTSAIPPEPRRRKLWYFPKVSKGERARRTIRQCITVQSAGMRGERQALAFLDEAYQHDDPSQLRAQALAHVRRLVDCDQAVFASYTDEFFASAPAYIL